MHYYHDVSCFIHFLFLYHIFNINTIQFHSMMQESPAAFCMIKHDRQCSTTDYYPINAHCISFIEIALLVVPLLEDLYPQPPKTFSSIPSFEVTLLRSTPRRAEMILPVPVIHSFVAS